VNPVSKVEIGSDMNVDAMLERIMGRLR